MIIDLDTALVDVRCQHQNPILVQHTCTYLTYKDAPVSGSSMFPCDVYVLCVCTRSHAMGIFMFLRCVINV